MIIYSNYIEIFNEMKHLILSSKKSIYIFSWLFDFNYKFNGKESFYDILLQVSKNVKIYILIFNNGLYPHIEKLYTKAFNIKYIDSPSILKNPKYIANIVPKILSYSSKSNYNTSGFHKVGCFHNKILLIDETDILLGGIDVDITRNSVINKSKNIKKYNTKNFVWDEIAIKIKSTDNLNLYIKEQYKLNGHYNPNIDQLLPFIGNFKNINSEQKYIKKIITNAKKFIYIEAQYIFSMHKNCVLNHLIKKILYNIVNNTDFIVIIVTNHIQLDIYNTYQKDIFIYKLYKYIKESYTIINVQLEKLFNVVTINDVFKK